MEIKSTVRNVITAPWIIADCKNLLAHFEDRKEEDDLDGGAILTSFSQIPTLVVVDDEEEDSLALVLFPKYCLTFLLER